MKQSALHFSRDLPSHRPTPAYIHESNHHKPVYWECIGEGRIDSQLDPDEIATTALTSDNRLAYQNCLSIAIIAKKLNKLTSPSRQVSNALPSDRIHSNPPSPSFATCGQVPNQTGKSLERQHGLDPDPTPKP